MAEDGTLTFSAGNLNSISISDPDAGSSNVSVTLTANFGTITLPVTTGLSFTVGDGTNDITMTFTAPLTTINARLDGLQFKPDADHNGWVVGADANNNFSPDPAQDYVVLSIRTFMTWHELFLQGLYYFPQ